MTDSEALDGPNTTRRALLMGAGAIGAAGTLAACGSDTPSGTPDTSTAGSGGGGSTTPAPAATTEAGGGGGGAIPASDIPVGGGKVFTEQRFVVTQPTAGTYKAFSATCTHQGCTVADVTSGKIVCACHGSQYNIADGSVAQGPATRALPAKNVTVNGGNLVVT